MADILRGIGRALGKAGQFLDSARMEYYYGPDWKEQARFLEEVRATELEADRLRMAGEQQRQQLAVESASRAKEAAEMNRLQSITQFAETLGALGAPAGVDTTGLPGSELAGPPDEGAAEALTGGLGAALPSSIAGDPSMRALVERISGTSAVRTTEERKRKRAHEDTARDDAATRRAYAAREQGRQDAEEGRAQERHNIAKGRAPSGSKLTENQIRVRAMSMAGARPNPVDYAGRNDPDYIADKKAWDAEVKTITGELRGEQTGGTGGGAAVVTKATVEAFARKHGMTYEQAKKEAEDDGYVVK